jgi:hypothetical protein
MFCKLVAYTKKQLGQGFMNNGTLLAWLEFYACHKGKCNPPPKRWPKMNKEKIKCWQTENIEIK